MARARITGVLGNDRVALEGLLPVDRVATFTRSNI